MAKPEWGTKRICPSCGTRYYDMRKEPATCPSCSTVFDPEALLKSRRARPIPAEEVVKKVPVDAEEEETGIDTEEAEETVEADEEEVDDVGIEDEEVEDDLVAAEDEDVLLEDAEELDDGDDVGDVVEVEGDEDR